MLHIWCCSWAANYQTSVHADVSSVLPLWVCGPVPVSNLITGSETLRRIRFKSIRFLALSHCQIVKCMSPPFNYLCTLSVSQHFYRLCLRELAKVHNTVMLNTGKPWGIKKKTIETYWRCNYTRKTKWTCKRMMLSKLIIWVFYMFDQD